VNSRLAAKLNGGEDVFMVDSIPVPIYKPAREQQFRGLTGENPIKAIALSTSNITSAISNSKILLIER